MKKLPPTFGAEFRKGNFVVRQKEGKYNRVWKDVDLEQMYNKDAKTKLFTGVSQQPAAIHESLKVLPGIVSTSEQVTMMANLKSDGLSGGEERLKREKETLTKMKHLVKEKMINPFRYNHTDPHKHFNMPIDLIQRVSGGKREGLKALTITQDENGHKVEPICLKTSIEKGEEK